MKWIVALACFAVTLALAYGGLCNGAGDCKENECCVANSFAQLTRKGVCVKLSREGKFCSEPEAQLNYFGGKYALFCPCENGHSCQPRKLKPGNMDRGRFLASLRCQKVPTTRSRDQTVEEEVSGIVVEETTVHENIEATFQENTVDDENLPEEIAEGPGGEKPREDDCIDWEYPC